VDPIVGFEMIVCNPGGGFIGAIKVHSQQFDFEFDLKGEESWFVGDAYLSALLHPHVLVVANVLKHAKGPAKVVVEIQKMVSDLLDYDRPLNSRYISLILKEIEEAGWNLVDKVDDTFTNIEFRIDEHKIALKFEASYPDSTPSAVTATPKPFDIAAEWRIPDIIREFELFLQQFEEFYSCLADIDENCWVLDKGRTHRKIVLTEDVCILLKIDIDQPHTVPKTILFLGPENVTSRYKDKWDHGIFKWKELRTPRENIKVILDMKFPPKPEKKQQTHAFESECPICFDYHYEPDDPEPNYEPETPSIVCVQCQAHYHHTCMLEWFMNLEKVKVQSFSDLSGPCPHCKSKMSIPKRRMTH